MVWEIFEVLTGAGRLLAFDNAFPTISFLQTARDDKNIAIIATQYGKIKHLPKDHVSVTYFWPFVSFYSFSLS